MTTPSYLAAVGSVRVWESRLMNTAEWEKMLGAKNFQEAFQVLYDLSFAEFLDEAKSPDDFEKILSSGLYETKTALTRLVPDAKVLRVLWLVYDLHNAKVLLKGKLLQDDPAAFEEMLLPYGSRSQIRMTHLLNSFIASDEDKWIADAFRAALGNYEEHQNPLSAEQTLDSLFLEKIMEEAHASQNDFVIRFIQTIIDTHNILSAFRGLLREEKDFAYISGGMLSKSSLESNSLDQFGENLPLFWKEIVEEGKEDFKNTGNLLIFENKLSEAIMHTLSDAKFVIDGPEPLIAFFWKKHLNAQIIRTILVGKRAGFSEETIRHSLMHTL